MRIRTQFIVSTAVLAVILLVIAASLTVTNRRIDRTNQQEQIARSLERDANELSYLSGAYLLHRESQQLSRWESKLASFSQYLRGLYPDKPEQQMIVNNLKTNQQRLLAVFGENKAALEAQGKTTDMAILQVAWSRMEVQNQGIIFDTSRLAQMERDEADELKRLNTTLMFALVGLLGAFLLTNYFVTYRRTLKSIAVLQAGTTVIGSGNLDFEIPARRNDEIGALSRAFNLMALNLKGVTASKAELETEVAERKRVEEERERLLAEVERRAAELDAANRELEAFSYSVSHDLRAPLRHVDGFSRILLEDYAGALDEQGKQYLRTVREGCQKMGQLIDELLKLSRVTRMEMRRVPVNLSELAALAIELCRKDQPGRHVESTVALNVMASGDPQLLRVALDNLLGNAWKFTALQPLPRVEFGIMRRGMEPVFFVKDNGAGFDMAYADKLFGAFQRLHSETEFPGTGIGLATVQRIIQRHGGQVWAESEVGKGSAFYFTLPLL